MSRDDVPAAIMDGGIKTNFSCHVPESDMVTEGGQDEKGIFGYRMEA